MIPGSDSPAELLHLLRDARAFLHSRFDRHGRLWRTRFVVPALFAVGDEANRAMLVTRQVDFSQGRGYERTPVRWVFRGSIMLQDGEEHATTRAMLTPAVGRLAIREAAGRVWDIWDRRAAALAPAPACSYDAYRLAEATTFEVAANVLVGLPLGAETAKFQPLFEDVIGGMMAHVPLRLPFGKLDRALRARAALVRLLGPHVLAARRREPAGLLGQLAHHRHADGRLPSVEEIVGHLVLLAWAGYDTTASAASWIIHILAERPDWQTRLRDEARLLGDDHAALDIGTRAPALESFLFEIERLHPSALFFPRVAQRDFELFGHLVPRDTLVFYSPYLSHRDPALFDNPNAFDPDRWSASRAPHHPSPSRLFGFGGGVRVCLGKAFAKLQLRLMSHALLLRHRLEPDPQARVRVAALPVHHPVGALVRFTPLGPMTQAH
jgi:cytochrome P450